MIKGNERRIIVIEKAEDPYFERIVFYIRRGAGEPKSGGTLSQRAQQIFEETREERETKPVSPPLLTEEKPRKEKRGILKWLFNKRR